jgi:hypothetical protein
MTPDPNDLQEKIKTIKPKPDAPAPAAPAPLVDAYVVSPGLMSGVIDALREAPHRYADPILNALRRLPVHKVPFSPNGS